MKAREYLDKYIGDIRACNDNSAELLTIANNIFMDFQREAAEIIERRGCRTVVSAMGVIEEQNKKWNALERRIEQSGIRPILKKNGFLHAKLKHLEDEGNRLQQEEPEQREVNAGDN